jgi:HSP20 family protein
MDYARGEETKAYTPKSYLAEKDGVYTLEVELPGVKKEDIHIDVESNLLKISAVRKRLEEEHKYEREYHLSNEVDSANIKASSENGILTLTLTRKPEAQSKRIEIG